MTSHHDVAVVVAELRTVADRIDASWAFAPLRHAADLLESQAKALCVAEAELSIARQINHDLTDGISGTLQKDRIESLEALLAVARKVIEPFAKVTVLQMSEGSETDYCLHYNSPFDDQLQFKHFDAARSFLDAAKETKENNNG